MTNEKTRTRAEIMLDQVTKANCLIRRLQEVIDDIDNSSFPGVDLTKENTEKIQKFRDDLQQCIDDHASERERIKELVERIPDHEIRLVIQLRYGLFGVDTQKMPWDNLPDIMKYEMVTIFKRHKAGIEYLNGLLEKDGENRC